MLKIALAELNEIPSGKFTVLPLSEKRKVAPTL
jgi:hypothetical protein